MEKLRYYLPDHMTKDHEKWIERISGQFESRGWPKDLIIQFWQRKRKSLNGFCALEAVCNDKPELAQLLADKILKQFDDNAYVIEEAAHEVQRDVKAAWDEDNSLVGVDFKPADEKLD